jgi:hypothetical protein
LLYYKDARVHCEVLKKRADTRNKHPKAPITWPAEDQPHHPTHPGRRDRTFRTQQRVQASTHTRRRSTPRRAVLTTSTSIRLRVNVPHSGACPAQDRRLRTGRNGHTPPVDRTRRCH